ncbi:hypothetical protein C8J57DRAFT_1331235 [Mycena rebaudengoi]|nr:hypothetical protein C8J57DRAFT_1331235 [Mycena rebaudengoi]
MFNTPSRVLLLAALLRAQYIHICCLPPEILPHAFSLQSETFAPAFKTPFPTPRIRYEFDAELDRLANVRLLTLPRLCGQWHHIVVDGPT